MNLGQIIDVLERKEPTVVVRYDFVYFSPRGIHSYRGNYSDLALGYDKEKEITVAELLNLLKSADVELFTGYKGGTYKMNRETEVWVAEPNEAGRTAILDIIDYEGIIVLKTGLP